MTFKKDIESSIEKIAAESKTRVIRADYSLELEDLGDIDGLDVETAFEPWEEETNRVIATQLVENIEKLLAGKATRSTVVNSRGEVKHRIIIEYD